MLTKTRLATGIMLLVALWFGLQAWINQSAIHASSALAFNTQRYVIAAGIMGAICWIGRARFTRQAVISGGAVGLAFALTIAFESQALSVGSAGRVTFLGSLFVAVVPFLGFVLRGQKIHPAALGGAALMLGGVWWLFYTPGEQAGGDLFALLRAGSCAVLLLVIERYAGADWRVSSFVNFCVVAAFSVGAAYLTGQAQFTLQLDVLLPAMICALVGSVVGMAMMMWSGRHLSATLMGVLIFLDSPFAVIWGVVLGKELLTTTALLAYTLIGLGAFFALTAGSLRLPRPGLHIARQQTTGDA